MDYKFRTTFWSDFTIADAFGAHAVKDTFERAFGEWRSDAEYVTELSLVLNWKCWQHYEKGDEGMSGLYAGLYRTVDTWCYENLKGADLRYYFEVTD